MRRNPFEDCEVRAALEEAVHLRVPSTDEDDVSKIADVDDENDASVRPPEVCAVVADDDRDTKHLVDVTIDSASDEHVAPLWAATGRTTMPERGAPLRDAQRRPIKFEGMVKVALVLRGTSGPSDEGVPVEVNFRVGSTIGKPILSLGKIIDGGASGWFDRSGAWLEKDGRRVWLHRCGNTFVARGVFHGTREAARRSMEPGSAVRAIDGDVGMEAAEDGHETRGAADAAGNDEEAFDGPGEPGPSGAVPSGTGGVLWHGSRVHDLRERLRLLQASTHGTKAMLWARLSRVESEVAAQRAKQMELERRHAEELAGRPGEEPRMPPAPVAPDASTRERHELTHHPPMDWCPACVMGQDKEKPHRVPIELLEREPGQPVLAMDFCSMKCAAGPAYVAVIRQSTGDPPAAGAFPGGDGFATTLGWSTRTRARCALSGSDEAGIRLPGARRHRHDGPSALARGLVDE